jgi:deoxycytidylate deaminase
MRRPPLQSTAATPTQAQPARPDYEFPVNVPRAAPTGRPALRGAALAVIRAMYDAWSLRAHTEEAHTVPAWIEAARIHGIRCVGVRNVRNFKALLVEEAHAGWLLLFDRCASERDQCRYLCHELAEFIQLTRELPCSYVPGYPCVAAARHAVACEVTRIVCA